LHNHPLGLAFFATVARRLAGGTALLVALVLALPAAAQNAAAVDVAAAMAERALGSADAPVTIVEYASMTCPHCANFHEQTFPALKERYIDTGKVRLVFSNFVLNAIDLRASMMARCVPADRFFSLTGILFKTQGTWARAADPIAELAKVGRLTGLDEASFNACMASEALANGVIELRKAGTDAGVASTPTFVINGERVVGGHSIEELAKIIDPLVK
jgi:protein-disulfide isomerase